MRIKIFLIISVIVHALIFAGIYFTPPAKVKKKPEFSAKLVTPEEARPPDRGNLKRLPPALPVPAPRMRRIPIPHVPPKQTEEVPLSKTNRYLPPNIPSEGHPVVPGEGSSKGKPLPEGKQPESGKSVGSGEGGDTKPGIETAKPGPTTRSKLFDRAVTDAVGNKDSAVKQKKDDGITFDTREYRFAGYMNKLRNKIESIWVYPPEAIAKGIYGDLELTFTINKDGTLRGMPELVRTSGYRMLDQAAIRALKDGEPYWPLPAEWGMETYTIKGHFIYGLHGWQGVR